MMLACARVMQVEEEDIEKVLGMFDALDADGSGTLDVEDIRQCNLAKASGSEVPLRTKVRFAPPRA